MCDQIETATSLDIDDRERRRILLRTGVGIGIATVGAVALVTYIFTTPDRPHAALLVLAIISAAGVIAWVQRCGEGHDHRRMRARQVAILRALRDLQLTADATRIQHQAALDRLAGDTAAALNEQAEQTAAAVGDLAAKIEERERANRISTAKRLLAEVTEYPAGSADGAIYAVGSSTPADGIPLTNLRDIRSRETRGSNGSRMDP